MLGSLTVRCGEASNRSSGGGGMKPLLDMVMVVWDVVRNAGLYGKLR